MRWETDSYHSASTYMEARQSDFLLHYGIPNMKWGVRRWQNKDGSLTEAGKKRYAKYQNMADTARNNAIRENYFRKQLEQERSKYGNGHYTNSEAWRHYGKDESSAAKNAIRYQKKANQFLSPDQQKDMKKMLEEAGVRTDPKAVSRAIAKASRWEMFSPEAHDLSGKAAVAAYQKKFEEFLNQPEPSKEEKKAQDKAEREKFNQMIDQEVEQYKTFRELGKKMKGFDKADPDTKFDILKEVQGKAIDLSREGGHDNETMSDDLHDWYLQNYQKAGKERLSQYDSLPKGKERDQKMSSLLQDVHKLGPDSPYYGVLLDRMRERSGDYMSRTYKTEESEISAADYDHACNKERAISDRIRKEAYGKAGKYTPEAFKKYVQMEKASPEYQEASAKRQSAWKKYCAQVLKDMNMPVNDQTIQYIEAVIFWD